MSTFLIPKSCIVGYLNLMHKYKTSLLKKLVLFHLLKDLKSFSPPDKQYLWGSFTEEKYDNIILEPYV